jgi:hypothetical protein
MRFVATLVMALSAALAIPMEACVSEAATPAHKHRIHVRRAVPAFVDPSASALGSGTGDCSGDSSSNAGLCARGAGA